RARDQKPRQRACAPSHHHQRKMLPGSVHDAIIVEATSDVKARHLPLLPTRGLQLLDRLWPVPLEQARQATIGEQLALSLTAWTIVELVRGVTNALHRCCTNGTGLAVLAMNGHLLVKGGHLLRKRVPHFVT